MFTRAYVHYLGLLELEHSLPDFVTQPRVIAPRPKSVGKTGFVKRAQRRQNELDEVYKGRLLVNVSV